MIRDTAAFETTEFDLIVVGGGIFGACAAWEAARRGLVVALIEKGDFCGRTSAHSFKLVHGGIRYLQHGDLYRVRQSSAARRTFLRVAPHLVRPLPVVVPTYGHAMRGKEVLRAGLALYDAATWDRNRGVPDPSRLVPSSYCLSRADVLDQYPGLPQRGLTGAGVFHDGQMLNPPRLVLAFVRTAAREGAVVANYVEATTLLRDHSGVRGVRVRDSLTGDEFDVRGRAVLNAAGPYAEPLLESAGIRVSPRTPWSRDAYFVVARALVAGDSALALPASTRDPDAVLSRGARHLFLVPWRNHTLVGVWHRVYQGPPDEFAVADTELDQFAAEINTVYAGLDLTRDDVSFCNAGLIPFGENDPHARDLKFGHRSRLIDHGSDDNVPGLMTLIGARFTTAPQDAVEAIDRIAPGSNRHDRARAGSSPTRLADAHFSTLAELDAEIHGRTADSLNAKTAAALAQNYGAGYTAVLECARRQPDLTQTFGHTSVLKAEAVHAVRNELASTLADVVLRRTELGTAEYPGIAVLEECAAIVASELHWTQDRRDREIAELLGAYPDWIRSRVDGAVQTHSLGTA